MRDADAAVCILGAGAAGLSAAHHLSRRGIRRVTVLERESRVGGRCCSAPGDPLLEMGAILLFSCYREVRAWVKRLRAATEALPGYDVMDPETGRSAPLTHGLLLPDAAARFLAERAQVAHLVDAPLAFRGLAGTDLCAPFEDWLRARGLGALVGILHIPVTNFGYGFLDEIPAAYALRYLRPEMLRDFVSFALGRRGAIRWLPRGGYQGLLQAMADALQPAVRIVTDAAHARIEREDRIRLVLGDDPAEEFDALLVTTPDPEPTLRLDAEERAVFSHVRCSRYATVLSRVEGIPPGGHGFNLGPAGIGAPPDGAPVQLFRPRADSDRAVLYAYARDGATPLETLVERCEQSLRLVRVLDARIWRHFPHLDGAALREGWGDRLCDLAGGRGRTYYAGSLFGFDTVEDTFAVSRHVAQMLISGGWIS